MSDPLSSSEARAFVPFGKYLLLERLAIGGMAEVYLAKSFEGGPSDLLAIKRVLPAVAENDAFIRMFLDEAKIAGRLRHPGIVRIQELGRIGTAHYLAMDFVWGKDLLEIMRRCRLLSTELSPAFVAFVGASLSEALHYAHTKKDPKGRPMSIIHRDISPQNVLLSFEGRTKIIDFGIAKAQSRTTQTHAGVLKGKVGYMSPEQVRGETIDHRSDIFAVGTCLYELLTLRSLFARENNLEAMENVREARAAPVREIRPDVPAELESILQYALRAKADDRFATARDLQYALIHFLNTHAPGYDRTSAVSWLRDAFHKEFRAERVRLDALDQLGRPQLTPIDAPPRESVVPTDLEIPRQDPPPPDYDSDDGETQVFDEPAASLRDVDTSPSEIFFSSREVLDEPAGSVDEGDLSLDASEISSGLIARLIEASPGEPDVIAPVLSPVGMSPPPRGGRTMRFVLRAGVALLLVAIGALGAYVMFAMDARSAIEVRTLPSVQATVRLDGRAHGRAPVRLENVTRGRHVVEVEAPGYRTEIRELEVRRDETMVVEIALEASP